MRDFDEAQTPLTRSAVMALLDEAMVRVALATAQVVGGGKTICFCVAQLRNAQGELVAQAMGTYRAQAHLPGPAPLTG